MQLCLCFGRLEGGRRGDTGSNLVAFGLDNPWKKNCADAIFALGSNLTVVPTLRWEGREMP
jgi:hypothetical protein